MAETAAQNKSIGRSKKIENLSRVRESGRKAGGFSTSIKSKSRLATQQTGHVIAYTRPGAIGIRQNLSRVSTSAMKTWETICNIEKNNKLHIIFSRKMILRSSMMPLLCSLRSSFRGAGSRRYRPSSPASMVPRILSFLFLVLCPSASSCDIPPPSSCTLVLVFVFSRSKAQPHHPPVDGRSSTLAAESSLHTGCNEYTPAFDYSVICLRARTESPNMPAFETLTCTALTGGMRA